MPGAASSPRPYHDRSRQPALSCAPWWPCPAEPGARPGQLRPTRALLADGADSACRMTLDIEALIERAGFDIASLHRCAEPGPLGTSIPHIAGRAQ